MSSAGKQVLLYLVDGQPGGLRTAEIANWTGHVVAAPRAEISRLMRRPEAKRTGVYLLLGDDPESEPGRGKLYVGESDDVSTRLRQHHDKKPWWDRAVIVTSQAEAQQLTKSQVRYLESRLIERARRTARSVLDNGTEPSFARLSEAEASNMDYFLDQLHVLLPTIGVDVFRGLPTVERVEKPTVEEASVESPVFVLRAKKRGIEASAQMVDGEFIVLAGSTVAKSVSESLNYSLSTARAYANFKSIRDGLVAKGVLRVDAASAEFVKDAPFGSPSTAGAVVLGRSCNGRNSWVTEDGMSFGDWEGRGLAGK